LLIAVGEKSLKEVQELLSSNGYKNFVQPVGKLVTKQEKIILVNS
jgi:hypothetical protein